MDIKEAERIKKIVKENQLLIRKRNREIKEAIKDVKEIKEMLISYSKTKKLDPKIMVLFEKLREWDKNVNG